MINILFVTYIVYLIHLTKTTSVPKADTTNPENHISPEDPNKLILMVSHYDCGKQNNLRQFSLLNVEPCKEAPSDIQHTKTQATVYVRAKAKRIKAFKCEAYIKTEKVRCSQTFSSSRRYDRLQWGQNTLELPKILDPIECKNMIRYLNATDSNELNNYNIQSSFSFFDDNDYQNKIERVQQPFRVNKLNARHIGTFVYDEHYQDWIVSFTQSYYSRCRSDREHLITRQSWKLRITNAETTCDDKNNQMIHDGYILPCYHSDGFCKPTTRTPYILTWFDEKFCLIFRLQEFIGRLTRIEDRYWIETDNFIDSSNITKHLQTEGIKGTKYPNFKTPQSTVDNPSLSRFEIYPIAQTFCGKPEQLLSTQYEDIFVTYLDGFDMNTGQPKPHSIIDQNISGKKQFDSSNKKYIFPALNIANNFATIDYDAHINTKLDFTINHVFKSMTVQELNTLHTVCELERTQLLTIPAMSVKNPQLAGFLLTGNRSNFLYVEGSTAWLYICPHFISPLYKADKCFDRIPIHYRETIMYVDPITKQTYNYATPIECGKKYSTKYY